MMNRYKITVNVPVDRDSPLKRMIMIYLQANTLLEALQMARGQYGTENVIGGVAS
jgi:hypothetical protein